MINYRIILSSILLLLLIAILPSRAVKADCEVNTIPGVVGGAGPDIIICDDTPIGNSSISAVGGFTGQDTITIEAGTTVWLVYGDDVGGVGGFGPRSPAPGENDVIIIHGTVSDEVGGDIRNFVTTNGGDDTITVSATGQTSHIVGEQMSLAATGGDDVIQVDGTSGDIFGERTSLSPTGQNLTGGNDQITVNGTSGNIEGDRLIATSSTATGGNDTITIGGNATTGNITGDQITNNTGGTLIGGNDSVIITVGATTGTIDGGNVAGDTDTLNFTGALTVTTAERDTIVAYLTNANAAGGSITLGIKTYTWVNFEILGQSIIFTIVDPVTNAVTAFEIQAPPAIPDGPPSSGTCYDGYSNGLAVKCFIVNDFVQIYSGFDLLPPNGFLVATFYRHEAQGGDIFGNDDHNTPNWSVRINPGGGSLIILDEGGNPISGSIPY